jgi:hypothetical protein
LQYRPRVLDRNLRPTAPSPSSLFLLATLQPPSLLRSHFRSFNSRLFSSSVLFFIFPPFVVGCFPTTYGSTKSIESCSFLPPRPPPIFFISSKRNEKLCHVQCCSELFYYALVSNDSGGPPPPPLSRD